MKKLFCKLFGHSYKETTELRVVERNRRRTVYPRQQLKCSCCGKTLPNWIKVA